MARAIWQQSVLCSRIFANISLHDADGGFLSLALTGRRAATARKSVYFSLLNEDTKSAAAH